MDDNIFRSVSEKYITTYLSLTMVDLLYDACFNLSSLIGDYNGRLPRDISRRAIRDLEIIAPGVIMVGDMDQLNAPQSPDEPIPQDMYDNKVTSHAYQLYEAIRKNDYKVVLAIDEKQNFKCFSPLVHYSEGLEPAVRFSIIGLYLDCFALYRELIGSSHDKTLNSILLGDMDRMITNLAWICRRIEGYKTNKPYELLVALRSLTKTLVHVRDIPRLFSVTYGAKLQEVLGED